MRRDLQRESAAMFSGCEAGQSRRSGELQRILRANHLRVRERGRRVSVHRHGRERLREERSRSDRSQKSPLYQELRSELDETGCILPTAPERIANRVQLLPHISIARLKWCSHHFVVAGWRTKTAESRAREIL